MEGILVKVPIDLVKILNVGDDEVPKPSLRTDVRAGRERIEYSVALIDPSAIGKESKIPELELPAKVVLDAGELKKANKSWRLSNIQNG